MQLSVTVQITVVVPNGKTLPDGGARSVTWDLRTQAGRLAGGGLYRARVIARDRSGRPVPVQLLAFGVVRGE